MVKFTLIIFLLTSHLAVYSQFNMLGKNESEILKFYENKEDFSISVDTLKSDKILITGKSRNLYPYHTYEIDIIKDECVSYGYISKNREVFEAYIELLDKVGHIISSDSSFVNFIYTVELPEKKIFYNFKQPFAKSNIVTRKNLFYIIITEDKKKFIEK